MRSIYDLLQYRSLEEWSSIVGKAVRVAEEKPEAGWLVFQNELGLGMDEALAIHDWLTDQYRAKPRLRTHWIRCGRMYVLNNPSPSLAGMMECVNIGRQSAFQIMIELEKKGVIKIRSDFTFEQVKASSENDLIRQMKRFAKKYRNRCEPELLMRMMYVDEVTPRRLSEYGARELGLRPKRWRR